MTCIIHDAQSLCHHCRKGHFPLEGNSGVCSGVQPFFPWHLSHLYLKKRTVLFPPSTIKTYSKFYAADRPCLVLAAHLKLNLQTTGRAVVLCSICREFISTFLLSVPSSSQMPLCSERQLSEQVRFLELFMLQFQELLSPFVEKTYMKPTFPSRRASTIQSLSAIFLWLQLEMFLSFRKLCLKQKDRNKEFWPSQQNCCQSGLQAGWPDRWALIDSSCPPTRGSDPS